MKKLLLIACCGLVLSSCSLFQNINRNKHKEQVTEHKQETLTDSSVIKTTSKIDTVVPIPGDSATLLTSLGQLKLRPLQIAANNGLSVSLEYDSTTGNIKAKALQEERLVPVKMETTTETRNKQHYQATTQTERKVKDKQAVKESAVNWELVLILTPILVTALILIFIFIKRKTSL